MADEEMYEFSPTDILKRLNEGFTEAEKTELDPHINIDTKAQISQNNRDAKKLRRKLACKDPDTHNISGVKVVADNVTVTGKLTKDFLHRAKKEYEDEER